MRRTDVLIVGGGLAGSTAAAMLGRAGIDAIVVDPHEVYPPELRCEKLDEGQVAILHQTGLADDILPATARVDHLWVARFGRLLDNKRGTTHGIMYDHLVNTIRAAIPASIPFIHAKVASVATGPDRQTVMLSDGAEISARLVVLANGLNLSLRHTLGLDREELSRSHSITIGFDMKPVGRAAFEFPALTYYPERAADQASYLTLFPVVGTMRANYMVYRDMNDPWLSRMRKTPREALLEAMPGLDKAIGKFEVFGPVKIRPVDLYVSTGYRQPGFALIGDAFATSCPAAGTGSGKALTDAERLCNVHIPAWLATPGMGADKIDAFYDDPIKRASDAGSLAKAFDLRALSTAPGIVHGARRGMRFVLRYALGLPWRATRRIPAKPSEHVAAHTPEAKHV